MLRGAPRWTWLRRIAPRAYTRLVRFAMDHGAKVERELDAALAPAAERIAAARSLCVVDCGVNEGVVLEALLRRLRPAAAVGFEIQGGLIAGLKRRFPGVDIRHAAVSDRRGLARLSLNEDFGPNLHGGASLLREGTPGFAPGGEVRTVDFARVLRRLRAEHDFILIKMDIEGSEYPVLEHLLAKPEPPPFDHLMVEFHPKIAGEKRHRRLVRKLRASGLSWARWI